MDNSEKERYLVDYVSGCIVWSGCEGYEEGHICDGIPDMGAFFVFKRRMKLAVDSSCGWRDIVRSSYLMMMVDDI